MVKVKNSNNLSMIAINVLILKYDYIIPFSKKIPYFYRLLFESAFLTLCILKLTFKIAKL